MLPLPPLETSGYKLISLSSTGCTSNVVEAEVIGGTPEVGSAEADEDAVPVESEVLEDDDVTEVSVDDGATEVESELVELDDVTELAVDDGSVVVESRLLEYKDVLDPGVLADGRDIVTFEAITEAEVDGDDQPFISSSTRNSSSKLRI